MLKKTMTYKDYNDVERTEDFYFNLNKAELTLMDFAHPGGLERYIKEITDSKDQASLILLFKDLLMLSYGEKSEDGKKFRKKDENGRPLNLNFEASPVFETLFLLFGTNADEASAFIQGIIPSELK